jgi:hypothetical protein
MPTEHEHSDCIKSTRYYGVTGILLVFGGGVSMSAAILLLIHWFS